MGRGRRARFWVVWATRDARRRWLQVLSIALLIALGTGMYSAMSSLSRWRVASADASFAELRRHDLRVSLVDGTFVDAGKLRAAAKRIAPGATVDERLVLPTQVEVGEGQGQVLVPGRIVGAPLDTAVDRLAAMRGRLLRPSESGQPQALLERNFAAFHKLPATGSLRVGGGRTLRYAGQAAGPEYFIVTAPGANFGAESTFAVVFTSLETAQQLTQRPGRVNELVVRAPPADLRRLERGLGSALPGIGFTFTRQHQEPAHRLIYEDAEGDQQMLSIFAFLILGGAAFAAFNMVSRTVEAQRREIGVGMALGVRPLVLGIRPVLLGIEIATLGVALGIPIGLWANSWFASILREWFPLPVLETPFGPDLYVKGAALGLALPLTATVFPVWRAVRVHPIEAIRIGARAGKTGGLAWLVKGIHVPGGSLANMPLRNVLRTPRRTALTALGVGAIVAIVVSMGGLMDSFDTTLSAARNEALGGSPAKMTVDLTTPQPAGSPVLTAVRSSPAVAGATPSLRLPVRLAGARSSRIDVFLETRAGGGLVIARQAAKALHVRVGDEVVVRHPVPRAGGSFGLAMTRMRVTGINESPFRFIAYMSPERAAAIGLGGLANRVSVVPAPGRDALDVKRALLPLAGVGAVQGASAITDAVDDRMSQFDDILVVILMIALVMALLMAYNTSAINADERARESATMFAFGVPVRRVLRIGVAEALMIGLLATAVGGLAGWLLLRWIAYSSMADTMPDVGMLIHVDPGTITAALVAGAVTVALAPLLTRRRLMRTDIPTTLRVVE